MGHPCLDCIVRFILQATDQEDIPAPTGLKGIVN